MLPYLEPAICIRIQRKLNSGLWLVAFGRSGFFRCQSTFAIRFCLRNCVFLCKGTKLQKAALFAIVCRFPLLRLETPVLATALCKSSRIRRSRILGTVCRFPLLRLVAPVLPTAFVPVRYGLLQTGRVLLYFSLSLCIISLYFPVFFLSAF